MSYKKFFLFSLFLFVFILSGCSSSAPDGQSTQSVGKATAGKKDSGITALAAWQEVQKEVAKWDSNAKLISIKDSSYARFQRQNGLGDVWRFLVDQCQARNERHNYCNKGKSRTYLYSTTKGGWGPKGVSAEAPENSPTYSTPIDLDKLKIDTDKAVELARKKMGQKPNKYEEFIIHSYTLEDGTTYWEIRRQCWSHIDESGGCSSADGYTVYVNTETGEVLTSKPRNNN